MNVQIAALGERLAAEITCVRPFSGVGIDVQSKVEALRKALPAVWTMVLLRRTGTVLIDVLDLQVANHFIHGGKRSITCIALERPLRIMRRLHMVV